ncbi:muskelin [Microplitis demolitor]|uniref:muskelin n=1 Tax=Microplitis demolitor TaxID=69319 RepID=UPI0006D51A74|nr:muskelin [Microplitis demolitor]
MASSDISDDGFDWKTLEYRIFKSSSYSPTYLPENILVDKPQDQSSRWSSDHDHYPQYLVLKLPRPSIVKSLTFGKFEKALVCNIKKFIIFGGMEHENMTELLKGSLKNDSVAETFEIKHKIGMDDIYYPIRYIKIMPIQSWGPSFNFSIWYVRLTGIDDPEIVDPSIMWVNQYLQNEILRLCMKYFRCIKQPEIVQTLGKVTNVKLEDQRLSTLYDILVNKGDYLEAERFITNAVSTGLVDEYTNNQPYCAVWKKVKCDDPKPGMRGGHQMVFDSAAEILYLFGGWNGNQDLSDFWSYNVKENKWTLICQDTKSVGGPGARSCHKMCLDPERKQLFTLGKYLDTQYRCSDNLKSDFYVYDIKSNKWIQISEDTSASGGPKLIFDHQMCMDVVDRIIYIFGGRILTMSGGVDDHAVGMSLSPAEPVFSDLFSYHVSTNTWKLLACDIARPSPLNVPMIKSRVGHSMLFHPVDRKLYIFAGQRSKEYLNDFFTFEVDTSRIEHISLQDFESDDSNHIPAAGYTQRATIDSTLGEIYVLSGLSKNKEKREENVQNSFWVYKIKSNSWTCVYRNENVSEKYWNKMQDFEPCPRFAHQLVYDNVKKVHYLFGGNPGRTYFPKLRLDDFWQLKLCRPKQDQILRRCKLIIRKHKFKELALCNSMKALEYLQKDISEIVDHSDVEQTKDFQLLTSVLFYEQDFLRHTPKSSDISLNTSSSDMLAKEFHQRRTKLFDQLMEFFPEKLTQPRTNLVDLVLL